MKKFYSYIRDFLNYMLNENMEDKEITLNIDCHSLISIPDLKDIFNILYKERSGYTSALSREDATLAQQKIFLTYGEILPEGLAKLFEFVKVSQDDSFVDLGSVAGKTVLEAYLSYQMKNSYGVEIDSARHQVALEAFSALERVCPGVIDDRGNKSQTIEFENINIINFDFRKVSLVFCNATCFGPNLMSIIAGKVNNSPNVRAVMSTHRMEDLIHLTKESTVQIEVSWHVPPNTSPCYVYTI